MSDSVSVTNDGRHDTITIAGDTVVVPRDEVEVIAVGVQGPPGPGTADATTTSKGAVKLAGDLSGTADLPTVPALVGKAEKTYVDAQDVATASAAATALSGHTSRVDNPHAVTKAQVGLGNVDNTSDAGKPISTATQTALNLKADQSALVAHTSNTSNPHSTTKAQVGLGNVDNTSDANKPVSTAQATALATKVAKGELVVNVKDYGAIGNGATDDTASINAAIVAAQTSGSKVFVPAGTYMIKANVPGTSTTNFLKDEGGIALLSNTYLIMDKAATLQAITTSQQQYVVLRCYNKTNVTIEGGVVKGDRTTHTGTGGEWGYGLAITGGSDITVSGTKFREFWGDGVDIQVLAPSTPAVNVKIDNITSTNNMRQGMSVEGVDGLLVTRSEFSNTHGILPECGVDIEPYSGSNPVHNMIFRNCVFKDNGNAGLLSMTAAVDNLIVDSCFFSNNSTTTDNGQLTTYYTDAAGNTKVTNNTFVNEVSSVPSMLLQGGHDYFVNNNNMVQGLLIKTGLTSSHPEKMAISNNIVRTNSAITPLFDTVFLSGAKDVTLSGNIIDTSATYNGRSIIRVEVSSSDIRIDRNHLTNSPRSISVNDAINVQITGNIVDNPGLAFVQLGGATVNTKISDNEVFGACHQNSGAATIFASGTVSKLFIRRNTFTQAARTTATYNFGTAVFAAAFDSATGVALDTVSTANTVVPDGTHTAVFYDVGNDTLTTGYLGEGTDGVMNGPTVQKPTAPTKGVQYFDTTLNKLQVYNGAAWVDVTTITGFQPLDATLTAVAGLDPTPGVLVETATDTFTKRTLIGTANQVVITNGGGAGGNPTFTLPQDIATTSSPTFASPLVNSIKFGVNAAIIRDGTGSDERILSNTYNNTGSYSYWIREKIGDAVMMVQADVASKAAFTILNSQTSSYVATKGYVSGSMKWATGRNNDASGYHIYTLDGLTKAASFDDSQNTTLFGRLKTFASTTTKSAINVTAGVTPTSPSNGDMWSDGTDLYYMGSSPITITNKVSRDELLVNVRDHGAVGNGTTNDAVAFQASIDLAVSLKRKLLIPGGTYKLNSGLVIDSAVQIEGILKDVVLDFSGMVSGTAITIGNTNAVTGATLRGMTLNGNTGITGIKINATSNISLPVADSHFSDLRVQNFGTGLTGSYNWDNLFENIRFQSCTIPAAFGNQTNNNHYNRCSFVTFTGTISFINCEGLQFSSCEFSNAGSSYALSLYQSNICILNPYIENVTNLVQLGSTSETFPSILQISGGIVTGTVLLARSNGILEISKPRITVGLTVLNEVGGPEYYLLNPKIDLGYYVGTPKNYLTRYNGVDQFPYPVAFGGGTLSYVLNTAGYAEVTASQGILVSSSLTVGRQYVFAYRVRTDVALSLRHATSKSILSQPTTDTGFETRYVPFIATTTTLRLEWNGLAQIEHLSLVEGLYFIDSGFTVPTVPTGTSLQYYRGDRTLQTLNTTAVPEGTNLYYTNARADARIAADTTHLLLAGGTMTGALTTPSIIVNSTATGIASNSTAGLLRLAGGTTGDGALIVMGGSTNGSIAGLGFLRVGATNISGWSSTALYPGTTLAIDSGTSSNYWKDLYARRHLFNSTANLDGSSAGIITANAILSFAQEMRLGSTRRQVTGLVGTAPDYVTSLTMLNRGYFDSVAAFSGQGDYLYCADRNSTYTITSNYGTPAVLFDGNVANDIQVPVAGLAATPWVLAIESSSNIAATDVLNMMITGHRLANFGVTFTDWKVETKGIDNNWYVELNRTGVSDTVNNISVPLHVSTQTYPDGDSTYHTIKGIRLTVSGATESSFTPGNLALSSIQLRDARPSMTPARGLGALDMRGGFMYGDTTWRSGKAIFAAGTTSSASTNIPSGVAPTTPSNGDIWFDGTNIKMRVGGVTKTFTLT